MKCYPVEVVPREELVTRVPVEITSGMRLFQISLYTFREFLGRVLMKFSLEVDPRGLLHKTPFIRHF